MSKITPGSQPKLYPDDMVLKLVKMCANARQAGMVVGDTFTPRGTEYYSDNGGLRRTYDFHVFYQYGEFGYNIPQDSLQPVSTLDAIDALPVKVS